MTDQDYMINKAIKEIAEVATSYDFIIGYTALVEAFVALSIQMNVDPHEALARAEPIITKYRRYYNGQEVCNHQLANMPSAKA